jgi:hypothetical protein
MFCPGLLGSGIVIGDANRLDWISNPLTESSMKMHTIKKIILKIFINGGIPLFVTSDFFLQ